MVNHVHYNGSTQVLDETRLWLKYDLATIHRYPLFKKYTSDWTRLNNEVEKVSNQ